MRLTPDQRHYLLRVLRGELRPEHPPVPRPTISRRAALLDALNDSAAAEQLGQTASERHQLAQQLDSYRYALHQHLDDRADRAQQQYRKNAREAVRILKRQAGIAASADDRAAAHTRIIARSSHDYLRPLVDLLAERPDRRGRILRHFQERPRDIDDTVRMVAAALWRPPAVLTGHSARFTRAWKALAVSRVRRCCFSLCDVPVGRLFLVRTSETVCPVCRAAFTRDTRFRVKQGKTQRPRRR